jgi:putative YphP/YqiW family bacilliredoxin
MYPEHLVHPMRMDIVEGGFQELKSAADVEDTMAKPGTTLLFINSVCGCSASTARPGVKAAVAASAKKPTNLATVFAGVDQESTQKAREYTLPYPPSSPSIALYKDGELVHFLERHHIEGGTAQMIADNLAEAYNEFC